MGNWNIVAGGVNYLVARPGGLSHNRIMMLGLLHS